MFSFFLQVVYLGKEMDFGGHLCHREIMLGKPLLLEMVLSTHLLAHYLLLAMTYLGCNVWKTISAE